MLVEFIARTTGVVTLVLLDMEVAFDVVLAVLFVTLETDALLEDVEFYEGVVEF